MDKVILQAKDLDGFLSPEDRKSIAIVNDKFGEAVKEFPALENRHSTEAKTRAEERLIQIFNDLGEMMQEIVAGEHRIHVYSLETPEFIHGEASRLVAKLRDFRTENPEFIYYIQRAYEMLFHLAFTGNRGGKRHPIIVRTPVDIPVENFAVHKIPDIDRLTENSVMCVMLRAALLPSMIVSKEIQEYSSRNYITPFALFKISRDDARREQDMIYTLDLKKSHFNLEMLDGKDLFFADPMNATGGSLVTIVTYLLEKGIRPGLIKFFNVVSTLKGALRIVRAIPGAEVYTLWMDPALNEKAYILPGLGDAGDRINGCDDRERPRDIIQLIADYGTRVTSLYRDQIRRIEEIVLSR